MSEEKKVLEIYPGLLIPGGRMTEKIESRGHKCPHCEGNGYWWQEDEYRERYKEECQVCHGSGKVSATVTIEWKAEGNS